MGHSLLPSCFLVALIFYVIRHLLRNPNNLPPSPPGDPIIGHALKIPRSRSWKVFAEWGKRYGSVIYAEVLGRSMIILNTVSVAKDILDKKSANFSDRPKLVFFDLIGWDVILPTLPYKNPNFRKQRRLMQTYLTSAAFQSLNGIQENRVREFLHRLLIEPEGFYDHSHGHIASIIVQAVYGHEISGDPMEDPLIKLTEHAAKLTTATGSVGGTFLDLLPFLRHVPAWVPGMKLKRDGIEIKRVMQDVFSTPFEELKSKKEGGNASPSIMLKVLEGHQSKLTPEDEADLKNFSGTFYIAGTDTTRLALQMFFLLMVFHPEVQKRAQQEIDATIGADRLPLFSDRASLPYIDCIVKEVLRVNPPVPLGIPHQSINADEYNGWNLPAKSMMIPNIWQMMRDEELFPDPEKFDPDRHASSVGCKRAGDDPIAPVFGFGRRACPGRAFGESMLWITIANVLAAFNILPCRDSVTGKEMLPSIEFESEIVNSVKPFKCSIVPRREQLNQKIIEFKCSPT